MNSEAITMYMLGVYTYETYPSAAAAPGQCFARTITAAATILIDFFSMFSPIVWTNQSCLTHRNTYTVRSTRCVAPALQAIQAVSMHNEDWDAYYGSISLHTCISC